MNKLNTNYWTKDARKEIEIEYLNEELRFVIDGEYESHVQFFDLSKEQTRDLLWKLSKLKGDNTNE